MKIYYYYDYYYIEPCYDAYTVQQQACMSAATHSAGDHFIQHFEDAHTSSSLSKKEFQVIEAKAVSFLIQILNQIFHGNGIGIYETRWSYSIIYIKLPSLHTEVDVRSMALASTFGHVTLPFVIFTTRKMFSECRSLYGHTYHRRCLQRMST